MLLFSFFWTISAHPNDNDALFCNDEVKVGAERIEAYISKLQGKKVGIVGNQSSKVGKVHLLDTLLKRGVNIVKLFSPEHGFRGKADAGEKVKSGVDTKTGLSIISLYGSNKKPSAGALSGIDILIFDIQDVGARFYTYISTLHYVMEACAENKIKLLVLDRPNPNGHYVDGPVLDLKFKSFIGLHKIPVVHGMSIGEYAKMINGEGWLKNQIVCDIEVVACSGWDHTKYYKLPIKPSPNLPNMLSIYLYPSLCFFEGTVASIGRGTALPFQILGHPAFTGGKYRFTPISSPGAKKPKLKGQQCLGIDFTEIGINVIQKQKQIQLKWLIEMYKALNLKSKFFLSNNFINLLAGSDQLKKQLLNGATEDEIRQSWSAGLNEFKLVRSQYLIYKDFKY